MAKHDVKIYAHALEGPALDQVYTLAKQPAFEGAKIRIMPDGHAGAGCVIGFTANLRDKICPNLVGVDIGCGMLYCEVPVIEDLPAFDATVHAAVPSGFAVHGEQTCDIASLGLLCESELQGMDRLEKSMGTLGGGNHFIELDSSEDGHAYLVIHSGSRNLGLQVAKLYQAKAEAECKDKVPRSLKYLDGELASRYLHDMRIAQRWARANREAMANAVLDTIFGKARTHVEYRHTVHNYIGDDDIIRKGAVSARDGEEVLIPLNMRDGAIIGVGLGNEDWNFSAPHGAGRAMSRSVAKASIDPDAFERDMSAHGVYTTSAGASTVDEAPGAYKPSAEIIDALAPTVRIEKKLRPVYNFKAH